MLKKFADFEKTKAYGNYQSLPKGGYVISIKAVSLIGSDGKQIAKDDTTTEPHSMDIAFDIAEGEYKDFYAKDYEANTSEDKKWRGRGRVWLPKDDGSEKDGWTKRSFKTMTEAFEESNKGYAWNWDEQTLVGKTVGGLFNMRDYKGTDGKIHSAVNLASFCSVEDCRKGNYKIPKDRHMDGERAGASNSAQAPAGDEFMQIPETEASEIPFLS